MAYLARVSFTGNASTTQYSLPFSYIATSHIKCYLDNTETSAFSVSGSTVTFNSAPASAVAILIKRVTPSDARLVDFQDGSVLTESDLDKSADQNFYIAQESSDLAQLHLALDNSDKYDAGSKQIISVADPTTAQGVATKNYIESTWLSSSDKTNLTTVAGISGNITTVAGISANVTSVAGDATDIGVVAGKATEIGRLGTADAVADLNTLGTSAIVTDLDLLATSGNVTAMGLLGNATTVTNMGLLGTSAVVTDLGLLGTSAVVTDLDLLATSANVTAMGLLGNSATVTDLGILGTSAIVTDLDAVADKVTEIGRLGTADAVADLALLGTSAIVTDLDLLATSANVTAMGILGTSANVTAMGLLGTADAVSDMNTLATAPIIADLNILATTDIVADLAQLATTDFVSDLNAIEAVKANVTTCADNLTGINNFADRYRTGSADPTTSLDEGDLAYNSTSNVLKYYNGSAWVTIVAGSLTDIVQDGSPQLGGDLDLNGNSIDFPTTPNISDVLDEDAMGSNSATKLATQQSIKAYADTKTTAGFAIAMAVAL